MTPKCPYCNQELEIFNIHDPLQNLVVFKLRCRPCNFETNQGFAIEDVMNDEKGELQNDTMCSM